MSPQNLFIQNSWIIWNWIALFCSWENAHLLSFPSCFLFEMEIVSRLIYLLSTRALAVDYTAVRTFVCGVHMGLPLGDVLDDHFRLRWCLFTSGEKWNWYLKSLILYILYGKGKKWQKKCSGILCCLFVRLLINFLELLIGWLPGVLKCQDLLGRDLYYRDTYMRDKYIQTNMSIRVCNFGGD